jgi:hypothetical protein
MCKTGAYASSLVAFGCATDKCGTKKIIAACAHCCADLARRGQRACRPAEHME